LEPWNYNGKNKKSFVQATFLINDLAKGISQFGLIFGFKFTVMHFCLVDWTCNREVPIQSMEDTIWTIKTSGTWTFSFSTWWSFFRFFQRFYNTMVSDYRGLVNQ
jgi:hypothetical protein